MAETIDQIERELAAERDELGRNLNALENKVRELTDWRRYYRNHPAQVLGAALAAGLVLGVVAGGVSSRRKEFARVTDGEAPRPQARAMHRLEHDWGRLSGALMGVASAKVLEFVGSLIPGFGDELDRDSRSSL